MLTTFLLLTNVVETVVVIITVEDCQNLFGEFRNIIKKRFPTI